MVQGRDKEGRNTSSYGDAWWGRGKTGTRSTTEELERCEDMGGLAGRSLRTDGRGQREMEEDNTVHRRLQGYGCGLT